MFKEATNTLFAAGVLLMSALSSCGPSADEKAAAELLGQAQAQFDLKNYQGALDSVAALNARYPREATVRKEGLRVQALATEALVMDSISACEPRLAQATLAVDSLSKLMVFVEPAAEGMDGYFIPAKAVASSAMAATGFQPRVNTDGYMFLSANISGRRIDMQTLTLSSGSSWTSGHISPARVVEVESSEIASISSEEIEGLAQWLESQPQKAQIKGTFSGSKGSVNFSVSPAMREQTILCADYATALQEQRATSILREKLERKLQTVRDHMANLPAPEEK